MFKSVFVALVSTIVLVTGAVAAPHSLDKGHWSLGYEASSGSTVNFGIGVADMSRIIASLSVANAKPGDDGNPQTPEPESTTAFAVGGAFHRYLSGLSTDYFSPFFGVGVSYSDSGIENEKGDFSVDGRFGGEAFVIEPLSIGGFVGFGYTQEGDTEITQGNQTVTIEGDRRVGTTRSALFATLYWGKK
jgi:hypothetical protein